MYFIGKNVHLVGNAKKTLKKIWKVFIKSPYLLRQPMRFSTNMKQILTLSLAIIPLLSWAYDTEVDGFAYNLNEKT